MSLHRGTYFYAVCDWQLGDQRCRAFIRPTPTADPAGPGAVIVGMHDVFTAADVAGWQPEKHRGDPWLCAAHRAAAHLSTDRPEQPEG